MPKRTNSKSRKQHKSHRHDPLSSPVSSPNTSSARVSMSSRRNSRNRSTPQISPAILKKLTKIFHKSQKSILSHSKAIETLEKVYQQMEESDFVYILLGFVKKILLVSRKGKDDPIERLIKMITNFTKNHINLAIELVDLILQYTNAKDSNVRFRVCQVASNILDNLPETEVEKSVIDRMCNCLLERSKDREKVVRAMAFQAMHRLQGEEAIVEEYIRCLECDAHDSVRCAAIKAIKCNNETFDAILKRSSDTHATVRRTVFERLKKVSIKRLPCSMLIQALENGLTDLDSSVQDSCKSLLRSWLTKRDDVIPAMIRYMHPEKHPVVVERVIRTLLDMLMDEKKFDPSKLWACIQKEKYLRYAQLHEEAQTLGRDMVITDDVSILRMETAFYWRVSLAYFSEKQKEGDQTVDVDNFLYENTMDFLQLLPLYQSAGEYEDITRQLQKMLKYYDFADPTLLENAVANIKSALVIIHNSGESLVDEYIEGLEHCIYDEDELRDVILDCIEQLRDKARQYYPQVVAEHLRNLKTMLDEVVQTYRSTKQELRRIGTLRKEENINAEEEQKLEAEFTKLYHQYSTLKEQRQELKVEVTDYQFRQKMGFKHEVYTEIMQRVGVILSRYLSNPKHRAQIEHLQFLVNNVVIPELERRERSNFKQYFIKVFSQLATLDLSVAYDYFSLYLRQLREEEEIDYCIQWICGAADIIMTHKFSRLAHENENAQTLESDYVRTMLWFVNLKPSNDEQRLREVSAQALLKLCLRNCLSPQWTMIILTDFVSRIHFDQRDHVFYQQMVRIFFKAYVSKENNMKNMIMSVIPALRRSFIYQKATVQDSMDFKQYQKSMCDYVFQLIHPSRLQHTPPSAEFSSQFLYSILVLMVIFEMEVHPARSVLTGLLSGILHNKRFSLLHYCEFENSPELNIYDFIYHAVCEVEDRCVRKTDKANIKNLKAEVLTILKEMEKSTGAAQERDAAETEGEDAADDQPEEAEDSEPETTNPASDDDKYRLSGARLIHYRHLKEQYIRSAERFNDALDNNSLALQSHTLVFSSDRTQDTYDPTTANIVILPVPLYAYEGTSDENDDVMADDEVIEEEAGEEAEGEEMETEEED